MLVGVAGPYLGAIFGVRRALLFGITLFFTTSLIAPLSRNLGPFLTVQFLGGVGSGTFISLTISVIIRSVPMRLLVYGLAVYAMNSELSQNVAASPEGLLYRAPVLGLDRLAVLRAAAHDVPVHPVRRAARGREHPADEGSGLARPDRRVPWPQPALHGARPRQLLVIALPQILIVPRSAWC